MVHVDHEPAEVYRHYNHDVELVADISATLRGLRARLAPAPGPERCRDLRERIAADVPREPESDEPLSVKRTSPYLRETMAVEDVRIST